MKQKIIRENGYYWSVADGAQYLWEADEKAARRRAGRRGEMPPTFRTKLKRFWCTLKRRLRRKLREAANRVIDYYYVRCQKCHEKNKVCRKKRYARRRQNEQVK